METQCDAVQKSTKNDVWNDEKMMNFVKDTLLFTLFFLCHWLCGSCGNYLHLSGLNLAFFNSD